MNNIAWFLLALVCTGALSFVFWFCATRLIARLEPLEKIARNLTVIANELIRIGNTQERRSQDDKAQRPGGW